MSAISEWAENLQKWAIPDEILGQAPESPWIHPPELFVAGETIEQSPSHQRAIEALPAGGSVLDVGCGGGIAAFACASKAKTVFGVDHQPKMLEMFARRAEKENLEHLEILGDWPEVSAKTPLADVVTCHHVVYNVQDIVPFLLALDAHALKRVVIEMPVSHPLANMSDAWNHFWNLERPEKPGADDLINVLKEIGINASIEYWENSNFRKIDLELESKFMRIRLCLPEARQSEVLEYLKSRTLNHTRKLATIWWDK
jgi:SAM-dependent methyltransferase